MRIRRPVPPRKSACEAPLARQERISVGLAQSRGSVPTRCRGRGFAKRPRSRPLDRRCASGRTLCGRSSTPNVDHTTAEKCSADVPSSPCSDAGGSAPPSLAERVEQIVPFFGGETTTNSSTSGDPGDANVNPREKSGEVGAGTGQEPKTPRNDVSSRPPSPRGLLRREILAARQGPAHPRRAC